MASDASQNALASIKAYAEKLKSVDNDVMDVDEQATTAAVQARLHATLTELQDRLKQRQAELDQLRARVATPISNAPAADRRERLRQLKVVAAAYESLTTSEPLLPDPQSAVQSLLAARVIRKTTNDTKADIQSMNSRLDSAQSRLREEDDQLADAASLATALQARTQRLLQVHNDNLVKSSADRAKDLQQAKMKKKQSFERETEKLRKVLDDFIESHLAAMLAAEEIGGPVVGELMEVDDDMLSAGFSAQGKPKTSSKALSDGKRQRRIDDIWGASAGEHDSEKDAAADEVRHLLTELMTSGGYVDLERDSAMARFLVRAKVAQFHPKDARRLRLIDFSRRLDD